ncbi:helix-turn-helix transcriptional regulator [Escherichia coli]|uniref:helix-turn-helix transcriptional regulator n=1 Tax=Escherichia TaxID=561 RepID=UPI00137540C4|nr:helix-turn-helix transcriptional regulator [Escherichia coli]EFK4582016.1 helix-turn-helix transcriptional regulator [Escherichia coli]MBZ9527054.1 helix-turn-helix transcriptional regulator [Escherichia coli]MCQ0072536.1 helix-turn-helix transcriptional regulator [Escherichia coli]MCQ0080423.1 helix-turn-helix transcriptional regulator [Escherichia coli]MCQ0088941.1 helix-turn-helix transcriptional regulator [Escherichia coli]
MNSEKKSILIYSSNIFFIKGVSALVAEVFGKRKYALHVFDETQILNVMSVNDVPAREFVFSDTNNHLFLLYLNLFCGDNIVSGKCSSEDVRKYLLRRTTKKGGRQASHLQGELSPREREIAECMKLKMTDDEIAVMFKLSRKTVSSHRRNIRLKLGIRNRNEFYKCLFGVKKTKGNTDGRYTPV